MVAGYWTRCAATVFCVVYFFSPAWGQKENVASRLSGELSNLLLTRVERVKKDEPPLISVGDIPKPDQVQIVDRRLRLWTEIWIGFVSRSASLTASQADILRQAANELVSLEVSKYAETPCTLELLNRTAPTEDFPVLLMLDEGQGKLLRKQQEILLWNGTLSEDQAASVKSALKESAEFESLALREFLIASLDAELFLSAGQQAMIREPVRLEPGLLRQWLFDFDQRINRHQGIPVDLLCSLNLGSTLLPIQTSALEIMRRGNHSSMLGINFPMARVDWLQRLDEATSRLTIQTQLIAEVRLHYYSRQLGFPDASIVRLRNAADEVAAEVAENWRSQVFASLEEREDRFNQQGSGYSVGTGGLFSSNLESHQAWNSAFSPELQRLRQWDAQHRSAQMRAAMAKITLALLDQELQFTSAQRELLLPAVERSFSEGLESRPRLSYSAISWLPYPLYQISPQLLDVALTPEQQAQWECLKSYYLPDQPNRLQFLTFKGRLSRIPFQWN